MPKRERPKNDAAYIQLLHKTMTAAAHDSANGVSYLSDEVLAKTQDALTRFQSIHGSEEAARVQRKHDAAQAEHAMDELKGELRMVWRDLNSYVRRDKVPRSYLAEFGLPSSGEVPQTGERDLWLARGAKTVQGLEKLMAHGDLLPVNGDLLRQVYETAGHACAEVEARKATVQAVQAERRRQRLVVEDVCQRIYVDLRHELRRQERPTARAVMRRYGIVFRYSPDEEALEQAEAPTENAEPALETGPEASQEASQDTAHENDAATDMETHAEPMDSYAAPAARPGAAGALHRNPHPQAEPVEPGSTHANGAAASS